MMWWMLSALANPCQTQLDTWADFKPHASSKNFEEPGGWPKNQLAELPRHRVAQIEMYKSAFKRYPATVQKGLMAGAFPPIDGLDEVAATLAWGEPDWVWKRGQGCRALVYGAGDGDPMVFESCSGELVGRHPLRAPISCARLDAVVPRIEKRWGKFSDLELKEQVAVLAGVPGRWMDEAMLDLSFGESTTKGSTRTYLDDFGVNADVTVQLNAQGYAVAWSREGGGEIVGGLEAVEPATTGVEGGPTSGEAGGSAGPAGGWTGVPRAPSARAPEVAVGDGRRRFDVACGASAFRGTLDVSGTSFTVTARTGTSDNLKLYTTRGLVRQGEERLIFEGLGSGTQAESGELTLRMSPWPVASCAGVSVAVPPG